MNKSHAEVVEEISPLERKVWRFWFYEVPFEFYLDSYVHETRPSKRHRKWEPVEIDGASQVWRRIGRMGPCELRQMPVPSLEVQDQAWRIFVDRLQYGGEYKRC